MRNWAAKLCEFGTMAFAGLLVIAASDGAGAAVGSPSKSRTNGHACVGLSRARSAVTDTFDELQDNAWYLPTADKAANLYVTSLGHGRTVVVLHGGAGGDFNYLVDAVRPAADAFRFVLFDQRGSVLSPVAESAVRLITLDKLADDLEQLRLVLKEERLLLFAHSAGTLLAMHYFERYPEHVAGIVLTGSFPPRTPPGDMPAQIKMMRARTKALMARPEVQNVLEREGLSGEPSAMDPEQRSMRNRISGFADFDLVHVERWRKLQGGGVYYNSKVDDAVGDSAPVRFNILASWRLHPVPIEVIQGDQDYVDPGAKGWTGTGARVSVIPRASHVSWIDSPKAFSSALRTALCRTSR